MNYDYNYGKMLESDLPLPDESASPAPPFIVCGVIGFAFGLMNGDTVLDAFIGMLLVGVVFGFLFYAIYDITVLGIKFAKLQQEDYALPNNITTTGTIMSKCYSELTKYGFTVSENNGVLTCTKDGQIYRLLINEGNKSFTVLSIRGWGAIIARNRLNRGRYKKAIVNIPLLVYHLQKCLSE